MSDNCDPYCNSMKEVYNYTKSQCSPKFTKNCIDTSCQSACLRYVGDLKTCENSCNSFNYKNNNKK